MNNTLDRQFVDMLQTPMDYGQRHYEGNTNDPLHFAFTKYRMQIGSLSALECYINSIHVQNKKT